eukprot:1142871-Pelagomonas_calceolata.AAC.4
MSYIAASYVKWVERVKESHKHGKFGSRPPALLKNHPTMLFKQQKASCIEAQLHKPAIEDQH